MTTAPELGWSPEVEQMIAQKMQRLEVDIVAVRQTMEQRLATERQTVAQLGARQDQMASEITKLQAAEKFTAPPPSRRVKTRRKHVGERSLPQK